MRTRSLRCLLDAGYSRPNLQCHQSYFQVPTCAVQSHPQVGFSIAPRTSSLGVTARAQKPPSASSAGERSAAQPASPG